MQIERDPERFGALQDRPEEFVIQVTAAAVTVDQGSCETRHGDRTPQLVGSRVRFRGWQRCETGKPVRMAVYRLGQRVVGDACERDRLNGVQLLHSWCGQ